MNKNKLDYLAPQAEPFEVRFEGWLCQSRNVSVPGASKKANGYGDYMYFLDDDDED